MKKLLSFVLFMLVLQLSNAQSADEKAVKEILDQQIEQWNKGNLEAFMSGYWKSDSLMFVGKKGVTHGWQAALDNYKKNYPDTAAMGKLSFDIVEAKRLSVLYYFVVGKWKLVRTAGNLEGAYTLLLKKIKNSWVIIVDHSS